MSNNLYMTIEHSGKTYKYPFFQVYSPYDRPPYMSRNNVVEDIIRTPNFKQYESDIVPFFSFLELPREVKTIPCSIDGSTGQLAIEIAGKNCNETFYRVALKYKSYTVRAQEPLNRVSSSVATATGLAFGYNYATDTFVEAGGGTSFLIKDEMCNEIEQRFYYPDYGNDFYTNYQVPKYKYANDVPRNVRFASKYYPSGWSSASFGISAQLNGLQRNNNYKFLSYPNQNPDGDNDDSGQVPPDTPIPGSGDTSSDAIPDPPPKPTFDVTNTGFVTIYNPSVVEIRELAYFMWSGDFVDLIKKMFAEPFGALISLKLMFVPVQSANKQNVWLGNVDTGVQMNKVSEQFVDVDMGTLTISEFFSSFADYAPYTKVQIFLPFIGYKDLNVDEVMNAVIHLRYRIDVYSGACIAFLTVTKDIKSTKLNSILYQFDGNCSMEIPFTSNDNSRYVAAILNATTQGALSLASSSSVSPPKPQDPFVKEPNTASFNLGSLAPVANGMLDILSVKPNVARSGSLAGAIASMGVKQPYVIIHRPIQHMPANYQKYYGIPLNLTRTMSELSGYTVVSQVFIESAGATDEEVQMITTLLRNGVIL